MIWETCIKMATDIIHSLKLRADIIISKSVWCDQVFGETFWDLRGGQGARREFRFSLHHTAVSSDETKRQSVKLYPLHLKKNHSFCIFIFYSISWFSFSGSLMSICFQISEFGKRCITCFIINWSDVVKLLKLLGVNHLWDFACFFGRYI